MNTRIIEIQFSPTGPVCEICGKVFIELRSSERHQHTIHEKSVLFSSIDCDYTTSRNSNLDRHLKRHTPLASNLPPKIARRDLIRQPMILSLLIKVPNVVLE